MADQIVIQTSGDIANQILIEVQESLTNFKKVDLSEKAQEMYRKAREELAMERKNQEIR